jgi:hypothetical protein
LGGHLSELQADVACVTRDQRRSNATAALRQVRALLPVMGGEPALLKEIGEYNYCKYTKGWM